jgi:hypothetical protein
MADFTLTIDDADVTRVTTAICATAGLPITGVVATDIETAISAIVAYMQGVVSQYEYTQAVTDAVAAVVMPQVPSITLPGGIVPSPPVTPLRAGVVVPGKPA